ncbi:hypothetical protein D3C71_2047570 [compost metagenome]
MAVVATLAQIDIAADQLRGGIGLETGDRLGRGLLEEQRNDLAQASNGNDQDDQDDHQEVVGFDTLVAEALACGLLIAHGVVP